MYRPRFICPSTSGHLGCFHLLGFLTNDFMDMGVLVSLQNSAFNCFGYQPGSGIDGSYGNSIFSYLRDHHTAFHTSCTISQSHQQYTGDKIAPHLCQHLFCFVHFVLHLNRCVMVSYCVLDLHFSNNF